MKAGRVYFLLKQQQNVLLTAFLYTLVLYNEIRKKNANKATGLSKEESLRTLELYV